MSRPNRLELTKTVESGKVKQNFQHGRSKTVTVEVRKTRTFSNNDGGRMVETTRVASQAEIAEKSLFAKPVAKVEEDHLTDKERQARMRALETAKTRAPVEIVDKSASEFEPSSPPISHASQMIYNKKPLKEIIFAEEPKEEAKPRTEAKLDIVRAPKAAISSKPTVGNVEDDSAPDRESSKSAPGKVKLRRSDESRRSSGSYPSAQYERRTRAQPCVCAPSA
jgi:translation initiation factor IF-2